MIELGTHTWRATISAKPVFCFWVCLFAYPDGTDNRYMRVWADIVMTQHVPFRNAIPTNSILLYFIPCLHIYSVLTGLIIRLKWYQGSLCHFSTNANLFLFAVLFVIEIIVSILNDEDKQCRVDERASKYPCFNSSGMVPYFTDRHEETYLELCK